MNMMDSAMFRRAAAEVKMNCVLNTPSELFPPMMLAGSTKSVLIKPVAMKKGMHIQLLVVKPAEKYMYERF